MSNHSIFNLGKEGYPHAHRVPDSNPAAGWELQFRECQLIAFNKRKDAAEKAPGPGDLLQAFGQSP